MLIYFKFAQVYKCNFFHNISLRDLLPTDIIEPKKSAGDFSPTDNIKFLKLFY